MLRSSVVEITSCLKDEKNLNSFQSARSLNQGLPRESCDRTYFSYIIYILG